MMETIPILNPNVMYEEQPSPYSRKIEIEDGSIIYTSVKLASSLSGNNLRSWLGT